MLAQLILHPDRSSTTLARTLDFIQEPCWLVSLSFHLISHSQSECHGEFALTIEWIYTVRLWPCWEPFGMMAV